LDSKALHSLKLTIGIPTFNRPLALKNTIHKLMEEFTSHEEFFEILVCDNGENHLDFTTLDYPNIEIRHLINEENLGLSGNIERLILNARGEYIWLLSDDDIVLKDSLIGLLDQIQDTTFDCGLLSFGDRNGLKVNNFFDEEFIDIDSQLVFESIWRDFIFISVAVFKVDTAKEVLKFIKAKKIINFTYPQLIMVFIFAFKSYRFKLFNGIKVLDSQPTKKYSIEGAFKVRIRDLVLLIAQSKLVGIENRDLKDLKNYVKSSIINSLIASVLDLNSKQNIRLLIKLEYRQIMNQPFRVRLNFYIALAMILQMFSLISIELSKKILLSVLFLLRKECVKNRMWYEESHEVGGHEYHDYDNH
jgi:glycosyltransferase involved in cell wall biosynthesis